MGGTFNFFNQSFTKQIEVAINKNDPKLLQVLLGSSNCQFWQYWLIHSVLSYEILTVTSTAKYQFPIDIILAQTSVLSSNFPDQNCKARDDIVEKVNNELSNIEERVIKKYKDWARMGNEERIFYCPKSYEASRGIEYHITSNDQEYEQSLRIIGSIIENFKNNSIFQPVLNLNFSNEYESILEKNIDEFKLRINSDEKVSSFFQRINDKQEQLGTKMDKLVIAQKGLEHVMDEIVNNKLSTIHDKLINDFIKTSSKSGHYLCQDINDYGVENSIREIKSNHAKLNDKKHENIAKYLIGQYKTSKDVNDDIINILVINNSNFLDIGNGNKTPKQHLLELGREDLVNASIFTRMYYINKEVFNFPAIVELPDKEKIDIAKLISFFPSQDVEFSQSTNKIIFTKLGSAVEQNIARKLDGQFNQGVPSDQRVSFLEIFLRVLYYHRPRQHYRDDVESKVDEMLSLLYMALGTGDSRIILEDYYHKVYNEKEVSTNVDKLYQMFFKEIIPWCNSKNPNIVANQHNEMLRNDVQQKGREISNLENEKKDLEEKNKVLEDEKTGLQKQVEDLKQKNTEIEKLKQEQKKEMADLKKGFEDLQTQSEKKIDSLKAQNQEDINNLKAQMEAQNQAQFSDIMRLLNQHGINPGVNSNSNDISSNSSGAGPNPGLDNVSVDRGVNKRFGK